MLNAAKEAIKLAEGKSRRDIENERVLNLALVRLFEVAGEAANRVSNVCQRKYPAIPWLRITGMRNVAIFSSQTIGFF